jgi:hypothetical protein
MITLILKFEVWMIKNASREILRLADFPSLIGLVQAEPLYFLTSSIPNTTSL